MYSRLKMSFSGRKLFSPVTNKSKQTYKMGETHYFKPVLSRDRSVDKNRNKRVIISEKYRNSSLQR